MMLNIEKVHFAYPPLYPHKPPPVIFQEISFSVPTGQGLSVLGASGRGKSSLCHILAGLAPRYTGGQIAGNVNVAGYDVLATPPPVGAIGVLFQDTATQLFNHTTEYEIAWGLEAQALPPPEIGRRVKAALARFDLLDQRHRPPWTLSGGQQKRLALAAIWAMQPQVLLLDEPLDGLDPAGRGEVLATLQALREQGTTLLVNTKRAEVARLSNQAILLESAAVHTVYETATLLEQSEHLLKAGVLYPPGHWPDLYPHRAPGPEAAIALVDVAFSYPDGHPALHNINVRIPKGQFVAIIGPNGAGKSTLIRHINGLLVPSHGRVRVLGKDTSQHAVGHLARSVSFLFQRPEQQLFSATVREEVAYGLHQLKIANVEQRVEKALARFGLAERADLPPAILSYGAQRAVTLAALAARDAPVLILDEPTVGLDGRGWAQLLDWLAECRARHTTIVLVTHELALAACADRVIALDAGRVVTDGLPGAVLPDAGLPGVVSTSTPLVL